MTLCETGEKLLTEFRNNNSWKNFKKLEDHKFDCDICSGKLHDD